MPVSSERRSPSVREDKKRQAPNESVEKDAAFKVYSAIAVHIADVMDLLPLLNRMAQLEVEHAAPADVERIRRKLL